MLQRDVQFVHVLSMAVLKIFFLQSGSQRSKWNLWPYCWIAGTMQLAIELCLESTIYDRLCASVIWKFNLKAFRI